MARGRKVYTGKRHSYKKWDPVLGWTNNYSCLGTIGILFGGSFMLMYWFLKLMFYPFILLYRHHKKS